MKFIGIIFFLFLIGCNSSTVFDANKITASIFEPDEAQFRRMEVGMNRQDFDAAYTGNAIIGNEMEVVDSLTVFEGVYCETAFRFYKGKLAEIMVRIIIDEEKNEEQLFEAIKTKLEEDYGKAILEKDYHYWRVEGGMVTTDIYLSQITPKPMPGKDIKFVISLYYTAGTVMS
jgi:hypothetical protein